MDENDVPIQPTPRWVGWTMALLALAVVSGVLLWVIEPRGSADAAPLFLLRPADGSVVQGPVELTFDTPAPLELTTRGWAAGDLHLHLYVDGVEVMPGARDIERSGTGRFRWMLPPLRPGERTLQLYWSDLHHRTVETGASDPVTIHVRDEPREGGGAE